MPFDQSSISDLQVIRHGVEVLVSWASSLPDPAYFQIYFRRSQLWHGTQRFVSLPMPAERGRFHVGAVLSAEQATDFSASLLADPSDRAKLHWLGGTYLGDDIESFHVYMSLSAGAPVSFSAPVATIVAYPQGIVQDGWGSGGWGSGGWGYAASEYEWTSNPLSAGVWQFAVKAVDRAGNESTAQTASFTSAAPPRPPAADPDGVRLRVLAYNPTTRIATLGWTSSPA